MQERKGTREGDPRLHAPLSRLLVRRGQVPPRPPPAPCPQGPAWRARRERPGRGGAPGAWQVARRWSVERRTTRRNGSPAGSRGGNAGMESAARSCSSPPLRGAPEVFMPTRIATLVQAISKARSSAFGPRAAESPVLGCKRVQGGFEGISVGKEAAKGERDVLNKRRKVPTASPASYT